MSAPLGDEPVFLGVRLSSWTRAAVIVGLFAAVFWPNLRRLWQKTNPFTGEANWGHAICVPIIGLYYLYVHREELAEAGVHSFIWDRPWRRGRLLAGIVMILAAAAAVGAGQFVGAAHLTMRDIAVSAAEAIGILGILVLVLDWSLATTIFGLGIYVYGIYPGQNDYLKDVGMVITLYGIVLMTCGRQVMRLAWFPIVFLLCAIPWPGLVYSWIAGPLQQLAANVAVLVLKATSVNAVTSGTKIIIYGTTLQNTRMLNVAEACAGMRSLMTFIAVAAAVAFLSPRPLWQRIIITISAIPIAIFCNVMRVSGQGLLDHYVSTKLSESFAHQFVGMIMLVPAFFLILMVGWLLDRIFVEEADEQEAEPTVVTVAATPAAPAKPAIVEVPPVVEVPSVFEQSPPPVSVAEFSEPAMPDQVPPSISVAKHIEPAAAPKPVTPSPAAPPHHAPAPAAPPAFRPPPRSTATRATVPPSPTQTPKPLPQRAVNAAGIKPPAPPASNKPAAPAKPPAAAPPSAPAAPIQSKVAAIAARTGKIPPLAEQQAVRLPPRPRTAITVAPTTPPAVGRPLGPLRRPLPPEEQSATPPAPGEADAPAPAKPAARPPSSPPAVPPHSHQQESP